MISTFWDGPPMPKAIAGFIENWRELHPDWEVRVFNDADVHSGELDIPPSILRVYDEQEKFSPMSHTWQYRSNIARLFMLKKYGGFWVDADTHLVKSLKPLTKFGTFVCRENGEFVNNGVIFAPRPHDPFIKTCIDLLLPRIVGNPTWRSNKQCGPHLITEAVKSHPEVTLLSSAAFYPLTYNQAKEGLSVEDVKFPRWSYGAHQWANVRRTQGRPLT